MDKRPSTRKVVGIVAAAVIGLGTIIGITGAHSQQQTKLNLSPAGNSQQTSQEPAADNNVSGASTATNPTPSANNQTASEPAASAPAPDNGSSSSSELSNNNYYTNSDGNTVHSPAATNDGSVPAGATAQCGDGTYSFSQHRSGTCSHHGGVTKWL